LWLRIASHSWGCDECGAGRLWGAGVLNIDTLAYPEIDMTILSPRVVIIEIGQSGYEVEVCGERKAGASRDH
jgi:hypothetical protein